MQYRRLGHGPLEVSELSFGTWLTVAGGIGRDQAIRCIHAALDHGITLFDTANQYGAGEAERVLGEALRGYPRDRYEIATKLYFPVGDEPDQGLSAAQIEKQLDRSLERLGVDIIDLYQCHRFDKETPLEETLAALDRAVKSGKVRAIGFSEWTAEQIDAAAAIARPTASLPSRPASRSTPCCGASRRARSFPPARAMASATSRFRHSRTACSRASTRRGSRLRREAAPPAKR